MARSTRFAESSGARDDGICTDICKKIDMAARAEAALCAVLAELGAENGIGEFVHCWVHWDKTATGRRKSGV